MKSVNFLLAFVLLALASSLASAYDPSPLQDFCVGINDIKTGIFVNGKFCKDPKLATPDDFFFKGLNIPGNTNNLVGSNVTIVNVDQFPGLNTLGISMVRIDYAPNGGENPPHIHPRASEILFVQEGTLYVGFVTSNQNNNTLFSKILYPGEVFVFPIGLIHFQVNLGKTDAVAFAALGSQDPGVITIANAVFGSNPPINPDVLARAFQLDVRVVKDLQKNFVLLALASSLASAFDPSPLQDFCVAINDIKTGIFVNGKFCKDPKLATPDDFFFKGLNIPGNINNPVGSNVTTVNVDQIPGLNTLGVSLVRIDYAPNGGQNPPHTHPRATEILFVQEGTLYVGFVTSNQNNNTLFSKILYPGDVFVFPIGLIHFQVNIGKTDAVAFAGLGSQNPGVITIANTVFGSNPPINPDVLARAFQLDVKVVKDLQKKF
ncbi:hypothetical protein LWI28_007547 [Acer negundo]|uniref:Cupin type-1 domain-containing protein n=1 Tax=Acer negundo TaxID=4023 RepID=A0AAD5NXC5_ACENE|nr:hypothetical protein LWI28_007547 [Acer negundo]